MQSRQEFWFEWDMLDLENAGAFVSREIWDKFIIKKKSTGVTFTPTDYTKGHRR